MWGKYFNRRVICIWLQHYHPLTPLVKEVVDNIIIISLPCIMFHPTFIYSTKFIANSVLDNWGEKLGFPFLQILQRIYNLGVDQKKTANFCTSARRGGWTIMLSCWERCGKRSCWWRDGIFYTDTNMFEPQITRLSSSTAMTQSGNYLSKSLIFVNISYNQQNPFCLICNPVLA